MWDDQTHAKPNPKKEMAEKTIRTAFNTRMIRLSAFHARFHSENHRQCPAGWNLEWESKSIRVKSARAGFLPVTRRNQKLRQPVMPSIFHASTASKRAVRTAASCMTPSPISGGARGGAAWFRKRV